MLLTFINHKKTSPTLQHYIGLSNGGDLRPIEKLDSIRGSVTAVHLPLPA